MTAKTMKLELDELTKILGKTACSNSNPCGAVAYYDKGKDKPYRIADDHHHEEVATFVEAKRLARSWASAD